MHELDHSLPINTTEQPNLFSDDVTPFFSPLPKVCIKSLILRVGDQPGGLICKDERLNIFLNYPNLNGQCGIIQRTGAQGSHGPEFKSQLCHSLNV